MPKFLAFFEIPAEDFARAVAFYSEVFNCELVEMCCEAEKMAFFPSCEGAISSAPSIKPSADGVLISLNTPEIDTTLKVIEANGGKIITSKTKIEAEGRGWFAVFIDCEGNKIGLYQDLPE